MPQGRVGPTDRRQEARERMYDRNVRWMVTMVAVVCMIVSSYLAGQLSQFRLVTRSTDNAEYAAALLWVCTESMTRTMAVVLAEDAELHKTLRALPPIVWKVDE